MPEDVPTEPIATVNEPNDAPVNESVHPRSRKRTTRLVGEWVVIIMIALLISFVMRTFVIQTFFIPSGSMEPTLKVGDRIIVSKLSVQWGTIHRGDMLVFKAPPSEHCGAPVTDLVKRVIGLPGDHLTSRGNTIYVNGSPLKETWTHYEPLGTPIGHVTVPANSYFMMGDNHPDSCDSRMWGSVPRSDVIGKVFLRIWPLSRFGLL
ncbi:MAG TPA: signal peptidase I [Acidimicrobiales bacterium]|nr:signal peptidase I [Acidimicrobiales bacterium]